MYRTPLVAALAMTSLLAACGDNSSEKSAAGATAAATMAPKPTDSMTPKPMDSMTPKSMDSMTPKPMDSMTPKSMDSMAGSEAMGPSWTHLTLTDVDGVQFTLADFIGKPVFIEHFATWCPKCKEQLKDTDSAAKSIGADAVVLALSIEADLDPAKVKQYAAEQKFSNVRFAVMTPEFLAEVSDTLGPDSINAPSTPHYIIDSHGKLGQLHTGKQAAADIVTDLSNAAM